MVIVLPRKDGSGEVNVTVRGMMPDGLELRPDSETRRRGAGSRPGNGKSWSATAFTSASRHANVGDIAGLRQGEVDRWSACSTREATRYDSEIWGDVNQMASDFDRQGVYSSAYLRPPILSPRMR